MSGIAAYLLVMLRMTVSGQFRLREQLLLGLALSFIFLSRFDLVRFFAATALLIPLPSFRENRRRIVATLAVATIFSLFAYAQLISVYLKVPMKETPRILLQREDAPGSAMSWRPPSTSRSGTSQNAACNRRQHRDHAPGPEKFREPLSGAALEAPFRDHAALLRCSPCQNGRSFCGRTAADGSVRVAVLLNWAAGIALYTLFNRGTVSLAPGIPSPDHRHAGDLVEAWWIRDRILAGAAVLLVLIHISCISTSHTASDRNDGKT
jgi:hypothetical protein